MHFLIRKPAILLAVLFLFGAGHVLARPDDDAQKLLDKAFAQMDKGNFRPALEFLSQAQLLADRYRLYDKQFVVKNNIGIIYFNFSDYGEALNYYLEAYTIAIRHLSQAREMTVLNNIGTLYSSDGNYAKGEEYFRRAYEIAKAAKNDLKLGHYALNLARVANKTQKFAQGARYLSEAEPLVKHDKQLFAQFQITKVENLMRSGKIAESRRLALALLPKLAQVSLNDDKAELLANLAQSYLDEHEPDQAIAYLQQILSVNHDLEWKVVVYGMFTECYVQKRQPWIALRMKDSTAIAKDSLEAAKNSRLFESNKVKFDLQQYKNDLERQQQRLVVERRLFFAALAVALIVVFLVYRLWRNRAVKIEQRRIIATKEREIAELELEKEKQQRVQLGQRMQELATEAELDREQFTNEIGHKNRQLSARALYVSGRNELISGVIRSLSEAPGISENAEVKRQLRALREHLRTDSEWDSFISHFEEVNHNFLYALKKEHSDLNANDIRFIAYLYMNLSSKEIGSILNITPEAFRKRKERISKKMGLGEQQSLYDYLTSLS